MRRVMLPAILSVALVAGGMFAAQAAEPVTGASVSDLHRRAIVVDMHADSLYQLAREDKNAQVSGLHASPARLKKGGVDVQFYALWVNPRIKEARKAAMDQVAVLKSKIVGDGRLVRQASTGDDIRAAVESGHISAILGLEGCGPLEGKPAALRDFAKLGVRYVSLTWNHSNEFGQGTTVMGRPGATAKGLEVIRIANEVRVIPDISHASPSTFWDVITESTRPVIASHSNSNAICPHQRNLDDIQLWAVAESGGFVGMNLFSRFVSPRQPVASLEDLMAHIRHIKAVIGPEHIGIGSDFDGARYRVAGLENSSRMENLTAALVKEGWADDEILAMLGGNLIRVLDETVKGDAARRVDHVPAEIKAVTSDAGTGDVTAVADGNTITAWVPAAPAGSAVGPAAGSAVVSVIAGSVPVPAAPAFGPTIKVQAAGPGVDRVALCASSPDTVSGGFIAHVQGLCGDRKVGESRSLVVGAPVRPHRVLIPELAQCESPEIEISFSQPPGSDFPIRLSEIVLEKSVVRATPPVSDRSP